MFKKIKSENKTKYDNFYSSSKAEIIIYKSDTDDVFQSIYTIFITNTQNFLRKFKGGLLIQSLIIIGISKYNPLAESSHIKLPKELDHRKKRLD